VLNADDATVVPLTEPLTSPERGAHPLVGVSSRGAPAAVVEVRDLYMGASGSTFVLRLARPLRRLDGGEVAPMTLPLSLPILGRQQVTNAAFAATAALILGARPEGIARALARAEPIRRRMQLIADGGPRILDDTVGNPASIDAVFEAVRAKLDS
jgi:UDP-N-acetylmuramoyl-tripeptide--D-alanyl-D-alanine ligase